MSEVEKHFQQEARELYERMLYGAVAHGFDVSQANLSYSYTPIEGFHSLIARLAFRFFHALGHEDATKFIPYGWQLAELDLGSIGLTMSKDSE